MENGRDKTHVRAEGFGDEPAETGESLEDLKTRLLAQLKVEMRKHLHQALAELEAGTLQGLVVVRLNDEDQTAGSIAVPSFGAKEIGLKLQEISMELMLPPGPRRELQQLMGLLRSLG